jgi:glutathione S-transferase
MRLELISHHLCPYVQRAIITLLEKGVPFTRTDIDLANKPDWFLALSPLGRTPVLRINGRDVIFESAAICEYLEDTHEPHLHPADPLDRARHRSWIEFASAMLNDIAGLYGAPDQTAFNSKRDALRNKADQIEAVLNKGPFFSGADFSLVDAAFGPVFRYFDTLDTFVDLGIFENRPRARAWRQALAARPSVIAAVDSGYPARLASFLAARGTYVSGLIGSAEQA